MYIFVFYGEWYFVIKKEDSIKTLLKQRILKYILVLLFASTIRYFISVPVFSFENVQSYFVNVYSGNISIPYWFLYSYLSILLVLPLIRKITNNLQDNEWHYLIVILLIFNVIIPNLNSIIGVDISSDFLLMIPQYIQYMLFGYYLEYKVKESFFDLKKTTLIVFIYVMTIILIFFDVHILTNHYLALFSIFGLSKQISKSINLKSVFIHKLASYTLIIYLFEEIFREKLYFVFDSLINTYSIPHIISLVIYQISVIIGEF